VATVDLMGRVTGLKAGVASITATCEDAAASAVVSVTPAPVTEIELLRDAVELEVGDSQTPGAVLRSRSGRVLEGREVRWESSAPEVAQVDGAGRLTGVAEGTAEIALHVEGLRSSMSVTVVAHKVASLEVTPAALELFEEEAGQFDVRLLDKDGKPLDGRVVAWSSDDPSVAEVSPRGRVTAASAGEAIITAECEGKSASANVRVNRTPVAKLVVEAPGKTFRVGDRERFRARTLDAAGRDLGREIRWVSGDDTILKVDAEGWVEAVGPGTAEVLATSEGVFDRVWIEAKPVPVVEPPSSPPPRVPPPEVEAALTEPKLTPPEPEPAVAGKSEEPPLAGVGAPTRRSPLRFLLFLLPVIAVGSGLGIWLTRGPDPVPTPPTPLAGEVNVATASGISTSPALELVAGDTLALLATALSTEGDPIPEPEVAWSSSNPSLATVGADGTLIALAAGSLTVTASVDDIVRELLVTIAAAPAEPAEVPAVPAEAETGPAESQIARPETDQPQTGRPPVSREDPIPDPVAETPTPEVTPPPPNGRLQLRVNPWARVFVDDVLRGDTIRRLQLELAPGDYRLHLENPALNLIPFDTVFVITSNETTQIVKTLQGGQ
jgi:uncharacterized protein YjdB